MDNHERQLSEKLAEISDLAVRVRHLESLFDALGKFDHHLADIQRRVERLEIEASRGRLCNH